MILVLLVLSIIMLVVGILIFMHISDLAGLGFVLAVIGVLATISSVIATLGITGCVIAASYLPSKIEVLETENTRMEADINTAIQKYCEYENKTYSELKPNEINFVFILYPELKGDEMVTSYINILKSNREEIKALKLKYAEAGIYRWWLYFGNREAYHINKCKNELGEKCLNKLIPHYDDRIKLF